MSDTVTTRSDADRLAEIERFWVPGGKRDAATSLGRKAQEDIGLLLDLVRRQREEIEQWKMGYEEMRLQRNDLWKKHGYPFEQ